MLLREWEVWYTYGLYFEDSLADLATVATELVASGLAEAALDSEGRAYWYLGRGAVQVKPLNVAVDANLQRATITFPKGLTHPFALETLYQCGYMRFGEQVVFGEPSELTPPHVRTLLGQMDLRSSEREISMYPVVKLHATGVLLISFRIVSGFRRIDHLAFIERFLHLPRIRFTEWWVSPSFARIAPSVGSDAQPASPQARAVHEIEVDRRTELGNPHLDLLLAPIANGGDGWTLTDVALSIADILRIMLDRAGVRGARELHFGHHWSSRPNVHLIRFVGQQPTPDENEAMFGDALGSMLAGAVDDDPTVNRRFLTANARAFSDYALYTNSSMRLWVHGTRSIRAKRALPRDPNRGVFVYEQQVIADAIDHAYALHHRFASMAGDTDAIERTLEQQRELVAVEMAVQTTARSGGIRDLVRRNLEELGVPALRTAAQQLLAIQQQRLALRSEARTSAWTTAMTFVFGLLAVPPIATDVIGPLWNAAGWTRPNDPGRAGLLFIAIAVGMVVGAIGMARWAVGRRRS